jgi:hypothetical protein
MSRKRRKRAKSTVINRPKATIITTTSRGVSVKTITDASPLAEPENFQFKPASRTVKQPKKPMRIFLDQNVFAQLEAARVAAGNLEFSGFGFVNVHNADDETVFEVYEVVVLDVGSPGYTEIPAEKILPLLDRSDAGKMKLWFHRHPLGSDIPGPHNWSATDDRTAEEEPLGSIPELVKWSISIVRTPQAWVGRFDKYKDGKVTTYHIPVEYGVDQSFIETVTNLRKEYETRRVVTATAPLFMAATRKHGSPMLNFLVRLNNRFTKMIGQLGRKIG